MFVESVVLPCSPYGHEMLESVLAPSHAGTLKSLLDQVLGAKALPIVETTNRSN